MTGLLLFKSILVLLLLFIIFNLVRALIMLVKGDSQTNDQDKVSMTRYIGRRLWFSVFIVVCLLLALIFGDLSLNSTPY